jgi:hypothetical protein
MHRPGKDKIAVISPASRIDYWFFCNPTDNKQYSFSAPEISLFVSSARILDYGRENNTGKKPGKELW